MKRKLLSDLHLFNSPELLYALTDTGFRVVNANTSMRQHFGSKMNDITGNLLYDVIESIGIEKCLHIKEVCFQNPGIITIMEVCSHDHYTSRKWFRWEISAVIDTEGKITGIRFLGTDITAGKQRIQHFPDRPVSLDNIDEAVISMNSEFEIKSWNKAAERMYGLQKSEVIGKLLTDVIVYSFIQDNIDTFIGALINDGQWQGKMMYIRKDNIIKFVNSSVSAAKDESGQTKGYVAINRDEAQETIVDFKAIFDPEYNFVGLVDTDSPNNWQMVLHWHE